jgi:hypothetical protein
VNVRGFIDEVYFVDPLARKLDRAGTGRIPEGSSAYVRGWAFVADPPRTADAVIATIDAGEPFELAYNEPRPEVVKVLGLPALPPIGFHGVRSLAGLARGPHVLQIALVDRGAATSGRLDAATSFEIVDGALAFPGRQRIGKEEMSVEIDAFTASRGDTMRAATDAPVGGDAILTLRGWAVDRRFVTAASDVYACIDGGVFVRGIIGTLRTDVAGTLGMQAVARCGFVVRLEARALRPGRHSVEVRAIAADGERYVASDALAFRIDE